mgnify:CR=1 FL=1
MNGYQFTEDDYRLSEFQLLRRHPKIKTKSQWRDELLRDALNRGKPRIFGEGDSWFDFPFPIFDPGSSDVLDVLLSRFNYAVRRTSRRGDTLANMCTEENIRNTVDLCRSHNAIIFLFSGGGNDLFSGEPQLDSQFFLLLNQKTSNNPPIKNQELSDFLKYLGALIIRMVDGVSALGIKTVMAGYGYAIPSGKAAFRIPGLSVGPWLKPALEARGYIEFNEQREIVNSFVDYFNDLLQEIQKMREDSFIHLDLRKIIIDEFWRDELHLDPDGFELVGAKFNEAIQSIRSQEKMK